MASQHSLRGLLLTAEDEDKEYSNGLHFQRDQEVQGTWVPPSSASSAPFVGGGKERDHLGTNHQYSPGLWMPLAQGRTKHV